MDTNILIQKADELEKVTSHPGFQKLIQEIDKQPKENRLEYAIKYGTTDELKKRGVPIPKDFKITPRIFEGEKVTPNFDDRMKKLLFAPATNEVKGITITLCAGFIVTCGISWEATKAKVKNPGIHKKTNNI